jgi:hypothetical protein
MTLVLSSVSVIAAARDTICWASELGSSGFSGRSDRRSNGICAVIAVDLDKRPLHSRFDEGVGNAP